MLLDEAEEHLGRGLSGVIAPMALTMAVLLALPSYLLLMAKQRAGGVIKSTTNNPVLNCQYQIEGKPANPAQEWGFVVNLYEEGLFAIAGRSVPKVFPSSPIITSRFGNGNPKWSNGHPPSHLHLKLFRTLQQDDDVDDA